MPEITILNGNAYVTCEQCGAYEYIEVARAAYNDFRQCLCVHCADDREQAREARGEKR